MFTPFGGTPHCFVLAPVQLPLARVFPHTMQGVKQVSLRGYNHSDDMANSPLAVSASDAYVAMEDGAKPPKQASMESSVFNLSNTILGASTLAIAFGAWLLCCVERRSALWRVGLTL